jgi:uncharacterized protein YecE (DUF72 family)
MIERMGLGLPFWGFEGWQQGLYARDSRAADFLRQYGRVFNAVEGNTTFYATPSERSVARWAEDSPQDFRFCFKLPKTITHDAMLLGVEREAEDFLDRLRPMASKLGPIMIQLPPNFGVEALPQLSSFLDTRPKDFRYAVEFRDPMIAQEGTASRIADDILDAAQVGRVIMDTRPLRDGPSDHPEVLAARHKKPDLPVREEAIAREPILRVVCHPNARINDRWLDRWAKILSHWIGDGLDPIVFVHSPSNRESPEIARDLHARVAALESVGKMPEWPGEAGESATGQLALL